MVVVPEDRFEKIISDPGASGKVKSPYVGGIFCKDLECGRRDDGEGGNGKSFVDQAEGADYVLQGFACARQGDPVNQTKL